MAAQGPQGPRRRTPRTTNSSTRCTRSHRRSLRRSTHTPTCTRRRTRCVPSTCRVRRRGPEGPVALDPWPGGPPWTALASRVPAASLRAPRPRRRRQPPLQPRQRTLWGWVRPRRRCRRGREVAAAARCMRHSTRRSTAVKPAPCSFPQAHSTSSTTTCPQHQARPAPAPQQQLLQACSIPLGLPRRPSTTTSRRRRRCRFLRRPWAPRRLPLSPPIRLTRRRRPRRTIRTMQRFLPATGIGTVAVAAEGYTAVRRRLECTRDRWCQAPRVRPRQWGKE